MAEHVSGQVGSAVKQEQRPLVGRQLLDVVTAGMYDNPLMIYREYIQNSVDSIDAAVDSGLLELDKAAISIQMNGLDRSVVIEDNGAGLGLAEAHGILMSLGCSPKEGTEQRGFRGIGRLGGLGYCRRLVFETRAAGDEQVAVVCWCRQSLEQLSAVENRVVSIGEAIARVAEASLRDARTSDPAHFFRVILEGVQRFHSDDLMNLKVVQDYLAQSAPVPYGRQGFAFADRLQELFSNVPGYRCYALSINNRQVLRPYTTDIQLSKNISDSIRGVENFDIVSSRGELIARGWYGVTGFKASLPAKSNFRGIRVRQGNIEVGGEHFLDGTYAERRFGSWQVGEIHVASGMLKPNARRDGFEHDENYERFREFCNGLGRRLSKCCRTSSNTRIAQAKLERINEVLGQIVGQEILCIDRNHYKSIKKKLSSYVKQGEELLEKCGKNQIDGHVINNFVTLSGKTASLDANIKQLENVLDKRVVNDRKKIEMLRKISNVIFDNFGKCNSSDELMQLVLSEYMKKGSRDKVKIVIHR